MIYITFLSEIQTEDTQVLQFSPDQLKEYLTHCLAKFTGSNELVKIEDLQITEE